MHDLRAAGLEKMRKLDVMLSTSAERRAPHYLAPATGL